MSFDLHPPNLNADLYKAHQERNVRKMMNFIDMHSDGSTIVGASDLNGRYWEGMVDFAVSPQQITSNVTESIPMENSITDGCFLSDSSKMIVADDKGELRIWAKGLNWSELGSGTEQKSWSVACSCTDHDEAILAVDVISGENIGLTGGADNCIKVWDLANMIPTVSYNPAHTYIVTDVAWHPISQNIFLSSSLDGSVALWNTRATDKEVNVYTGPSCAARCVCWLSDHIFAVGYENGEIIVRDKRSTIPESILYTSKCDYPIDKLEFSPESQMMAVCGDSNIVNVYKFSSRDLKLVYQDSKHTDYVRGFVWNKTEKNILYSCGWDEKVLEHSIN